MTGITVRTLHHYDEIGLLSPSNHTESGHRLYTHTEVVRLQHIVSLRHLGFSLEQVQEALSQPAFSPLKIIPSLRAELRQRRIECEELDERLERIEQMMPAGKDVSTGDLIEIIERITMFEKYLTKEQIAKIDEIQKQLGPQRIEEMTTTDWPQLIGEVQEQMERGTNPSSPNVHALALRWMKLLNEKTGGDTELAKGYGEIIEKDPSFATDSVAKMGHPEANLPKLIQYIGRALSTATDE